MPSGSPARPSRHGSRLGWEFVQDFTFYIAQSPQLRYRPTGYEHTRASSGLFHHPTDRPPELLLQHRSRLNRSSLQLAVHHKASRDRLTSSKRPPPGHSLELNAGKPCLCWAEQALRRITVACTNASSTWAFDDPPFVLLSSPRAFTPRATQVRDAFFSHRPFPVFLFLGAPGRRSPKKHHNRSAVRSDLIWVGSAESENRDRLLACLSPGSVLHVVQ